VGLPLLKSKHCHIFEVEIAFNIPAAKRGIPVVLDCLELCDESLGLLLLYKQ
jgi:hypothetical protein